MQQSHASLTHIVNGSSEKTTDLEPKAPEPAASSSVEPKPARADPMSFSSILSSTAEPSKPAATPKVAPAPAAKQLRRASRASNGDLEPPASTPVHNHAPRKQVIKPSPAKENHGAREHGHSREPAKTKAPKSAAAKKAVTGSDKENERVTQMMAEIDAMEHSDLDGTGYDAARTKHDQLSLKRAKNIEEAEDSKRKVSLLCNVVLSES